MQRLILGAAGLLLSSSALAGVTMTKADGAKSMDASPSAISLQAKAADGLDDSMINNAMLIDWTAKNAVAAEPASLAYKTMDEPKMIQAQAIEPAPAPSAETMAVESEEAAIEDGVGGPIETADAGAASLDLSPRAAAQNYPACVPGPGDDRCIQLYEPGVQTALASWSGPTGGLDDGGTGMGGPEEVIDESSASKASHEEAAYDPLPEDAVMPADEDLALTDSPTSGSTLAI